MFDKLNNMGRGFTFISFLTGITMMIVMFFMAALMECNVPISLKYLFDKISETSFFELLFYMAVFTIGFFIHGIRYWGFDYYKRLYDEYNQKQKDKDGQENKDKEEGEGKGEQEKKKKRPLPMRIMFYMFRKGTIVEECLNEKRHLDATYNWIRTSNKPEADVWNHAKKISLEFPQVDVYKFYYHSEVFQCFDTVFFMSFFVSFCIGMYGTIGTFIVAIICKSFDRKYLLLLFFSLVLFFFHWICKETSRAFARRFFLEIQTDLNVLNEKERINIGKTNP